MVFTIVSSSQGTELRVVSERVFKDNIVVSNGDLLRVSWTEECNKASNKFSGDSLGMTIVAVEVREARAFMFSFHQGGAQISWELLTREQSPAGEVTAFIVLMVKS